MKLNGHELDKKHTFSSCTLPDYNKIIENPQDALDKKAKRTDYLEINAQVLDTKKSQYGIQTGKVLSGRSLVIRRVFNRASVHLLSNGSRIMKERSKYSNCLHCIVSAFIKYNIITDMSFLPE